jgi:hypothetical protein
LAIPQRLRRILSKATGIDRFGHFAGLTLSLHIEMIDTLREFTNFAAGA